MSVSPALCVCACVCVCSKGVYHVGAVQTELKERWTTVGHLIEARRTALGQCRQVFKCEQDVVKVIAWLQHLANQMISTQGDLGESQEAVQHLRLDHRKFVETAKVRSIKLVQCLCG